MTPHNKGKRYFKPICKGEGCGIYLHDKLIRKNGYYCNECLNKKRRVPEEQKKQKKIHRCEVCETPISAYARHCQEHSQGNSNHNKWYQTKLDEEAYRQAYKVQQVALIPNTNRVVTKTGMFGFGKY